MTSPPVSNPTLRSLLRSAATALTFCALIILAALAMQAQTFNVIHQFSLGPAGNTPVTGVTIDARGRLYGTTSSGGVSGYYCDMGCGVVYRLAPEGSGWIYTPLYAFRGPTGDGDGPNSRPAFAPNGILYGTTGAGGTNFCEGPGCGTVYSLRPHATACTTALCAWQESVIYSFANDYGGPGYGALVFDAQGNVYGTAVGGGPGDTGGAVYEMTLSNGQWVYQNLYVFTGFAGGSDGSFAEGGVIFDGASNLYGTTSEGGGQGCSDRGCGTVFELSPNGSGWTEKILYAFEDGPDGAGPVAGLIMDAGGNLYGTTTSGGQNGGGTVFELSPSGSNWNFNLLYSFSHTEYYGGASGSLAMDSSGNLYGTTLYGGSYGWGSIFKLSPSGGGWTYASLHDFTFGNDGAVPQGDVTLDGNGNLYGTTSEGGTYDCAQDEGCGVVWEVTP
jgi:uncharacterized repeat protein (TIGR03803 family)